MFVFELQVILHVIFLILKNKAVSQRSLGLLLTVFQFEFESDGLSAHLLSTTLPLVILQQAIGVFRSTVT